MRMPPGSRTRATLMSPCTAGGATNCPPAAVARATAVSMSDVEVADEALLDLRRTETDSPDQEAVLIRESQSTAALLDLPAEDLAVKSARLAEVCRRDVQVCEAAVTRERIVDHGA